MIKLNKNAIEYMEKMGFSDIVLKVTEFTS